MKGRFVRAADGATGGAVGGIDVDDEEGEEEDDDEGEARSLGTAGAVASETKRPREPDAKAEKHVAFKQDNIEFAESGAIEGHDVSDDVDNEEGHVARRKKMRRHSIAY